MSMNSDYSLADIAAATGNGNGNGNCNGWGGDWSAWIIIFLIFALGGWGNGNGLFGGNGNQGAAENYVLASDFATLQRQIDGVSSRLEGKGDTIINGLCDGFYTQAQLINGVNTQIASCCCDIREAIAGVNYNMALGNNNIQSQIASCCCDVERQIERGFADTNYNLATQNCATLQAVDKVGDRIIDYLTAEKMQTLRDENQALRLTASQQAQNAYLVDQLGYQCPKPAYVVQPPQNVTFPTNCCGGVTYANYGGNCGVCGCG